MQYCPHTDEATRLSLLRVRLAEEKIQAEALGDGRLYVDKLNELKPIDEALDELLKAHRLTCLASGTDCDCTGTVCGHLAFTEGIKLRGEAL
jgi:hypothetical protein